VFEDGSNEINDKFQRSLVVIINDDDSPQVAALVRHVAHQALTAHGSHYRAARVIESLRPKPKAPARPGKDLPPTRFPWGPLWFRDFRGR
jgi:hypothetical protein